MAYRLLFFRVARSSSPSVTSFMGILTTIAEVSKSGLLPAVSRLTLQVPKYCPFGRFWYMLYRHFDHKVEGITKKLEHAITRIT